MVANDPGTAGMKLETNWLASTAATAISFETPAATRAPVAGGAHERIDGIADEQERDLSGRTERGPDRGQPALDGWEDRTAATGGEAYGAAAREDTAVGPASPRRVISSVGR